ncbi:MAG: hypothetical protein RQ826_10490, partial [Xanthomonadales bacterium]|nr:hypothetical protein [Xanthomonadales bacterium]
GRFGPLQHLGGGGRVEALLDLTAGEFSLHLDGAAADVAALRELDLHLELTGPEFRWITDQFGLPAFSNGAVDVTANIETREGHARLGLDGYLGSLEVNADGTLDDLLAPTTGELAFDLRGPDLEALSAALGQAIPLAEAYELHGRARIRDRTAQLEELVFQAGPNSGELSGAVGLARNLSGTDLEMRFSGPDFSGLAAAFGAPGLIDAAFTARAAVTVDDASLRIEDFVLEVGEHRAAINGTIEADHDRLIDRLDIRLAGPDSSAWREALGIDGLPAQPYELDLQLERAAGARMRLEGSLTAGANTLRLTGTLAQLRSLTGASLQMEAEFAEPGLILSVPDTFSLPTAALSLGGRLEVNADSWLLEDGHASLEEHDLFFSGAVSRAEKSVGTRLQGRLESSGLQQVGRWFGVAGLPDATLRAPFEIEWCEAGPHLKITAGRLGEMDLELDANLPQPWGSEPLTLDFRLAAPGLAAVPFAAGRRLVNLPGSFEASGGIDFAANRDRFRDIVLRTGEIEARLRGHTADIRNLVDSRFTVSVKGPDLSVMNVVLGLDFPALAFAGEAEISGGSGQFRLEPLRAEWGSSDLSGGIDLQLGETPEVSGTLESAFLDLAWLGDSPDGAASDGDALLFPDRAVPALDAGGLSLQLELDIARMALPLTELRTVHAGLQFRERRLDLRPLQMSGAHGGRLEAELSIEGGDTTSVEVTASGDALRLGLFAGDDPDSAVLPVTDFEADLAAVGSTWHELAASLDGRFIARQGAGRLVNRGLESLFSDALSELFKTINPFADRESHTELECAVFAARADQGTVIIDPWVIQTAKLVILSGGMVDLDTEIINMDFRARARQGLGISAGTLINPFTRLAGTLSSPELVFDATGTALSGTVAIATAGLSLLGRPLYDRFMGSQNPCGDALQKLRETDGFEP